MVMRSPVHSGCLEQLAGGDRDGDRVRLATLEMDRRGEVPNGCDARSMPR
jgi:hypothetical protein